MNVSGTKELDASREVVWSVINDPAQMAGLMPGVEGPIVWRSCNPYHRVWEMLQSPAETRKFVSVESR